MSLLGHARGASSRCTGSEKLIFSDSHDGPEKAWHWREWRCDFSAPGNRRAGCMTCGPRPPCWTAGCSEAEGAHNRGAVVCFLCGGSPFLTAGYGEDEGALNRGAVACPLCGGSPF
jgi:hypothetical protein